MRKEYLELVSCRAAEFSRRASVMESWETQTKPVTKGGGRTKPENNFHTNAKSRWRKGEPENSGGYQKKQIQATGDLGKDNPRTNTDKAHVHRVGGKERTISKHARKLKNNKTRPIMQVCVKRSGGGGGAARDITSGPRLEST